MNLEIIRGLQEGQDVIDGKQIEPYCKEVNYFDFIVNHKLDDDTLGKLIEIQDEVFNSKKFPHQGTLAGNIEHEYQLSEKQEKVIIPTVIDLWTKSQKIDWDGEWMSNSWVNFQKKHEFNPLHNHGGEFSYVVWTKIPYNLKDEMNLPWVKNSGSPYASVFSFMLPQFPGIQPLPYFLDKHHAGWMVVFPSMLNHLVYPFYTSDEYRVSFAGNVWRDNGNPLSFLENERIV